ncbi:MAG: sulfotransferase [Lentimicrobium sp.]
MDSRDRPFRFPVSILAGSSPANILQVIKGHSIDIRYYPKFLLTFLISVIFEPFNLAEKLIFAKKFKNIHTEEPPVFIIGFWRSGTTILHSLLCQDPKAGYVTTFQGVFPNLVLSQQKWLKAITNKLLPKKRPFDGYSMDMDFPQEEDFALMSLQPKSLYKMFYFPKDFNIIYSRELNFEQFPVSQKELWKTKYLSLYKKAMLNTGGKRYVSKNPCHIFRIRTLTELFPEARFIFIYRNPYSVVESLYRFVNEVLPGSELQHSSGGIAREHFAVLYRDAMQAYENVKGIIKQGNLMEIRYEEFKKQPSDFLCEIYSRFNLTGFEEALPLMESYLAKNKTDDREPYQIEAETYTLVNLYAQEIVNRLGYQISGQPE